MPLIEKMKRKGLSPVRESQDPYSDSAKKYPENPIYEKELHYLMMDG